MRRIRPSSSAVGGRVSSPITSMRTFPFGMRHATFTAARRSKRARYSAMLDQGSGTSTRPLNPAV